ncbi:glycosyltransferase [Winogradskyella sp.]|nr:glycosyltransferase [Winogradskyella sp.]
MADLIEGLETFAEVTWDFKEFWNMENSYDIVHIHWPEYLSFEIESYLKTTEPLPQALWQNLEVCLNYWSKHTTIVYTRHVRAPHGRDDEEFKKLYCKVFGYCKAMTHFAEFSVEQYYSYFPGIKVPIHRVIPQHKHTSLPNTSNRQSARKALGIEPDAKVLLCFGTIKENEKAFIKKTYHAITAKPKVLLAPGWKVNRRKIGYIRLREWVWKLEQWWVSKNQSFRINLGFITEDEAHLYCNAADVLLIPRTDELFSGNISLAFSFGLVVLGKDDSNIGEILEKYHNPTFKVGDMNSMEKSINQAFQLAQTSLGAKNKQVADSIWSIENTIKRYKSFYNDAIKVKTKKGSI